MIVKRTLRTYVSALLLLCLAVQLAPFGLIHSHDDHHEAEGIHISHADHDDSTAHLSPSENEDFQFESQDDCDFCKILHALNDQEYVNSSQSLSAVYDFTAVSTYDVVTSKLGETVSSSQGRAPPTA